ncbi:MAG: flap endonuclease-1 [Candidatus Diapherotrites archaeon]|nr:flap endonuclease-1 [Candidatus Diapherotrites archaeon]
MGLAISEIVPAHTVEVEHLTGRVIAVDAYNTLYQFLSIIRQPDGTPLQNSKGEISSHLTGLLYRTSKLVEAGIRPVYVFDGVPPERKHETLLKRAAIRKEAKLKWEAALERGAEEEARLYAQQAVRLSEGMVTDSKALLDGLGVPWVQAPGEGEAQASLMAARGAAWAVGSQDFDSLLFNAPRLVRNLTITGKRKVPRKDVYVVVKPEIIHLSEVFSSLGVTRDQLLEIALMIGTDYNAGVKGIGPKKALALVQKGRTADDAYGEAGLDASSLGAVRELFSNPLVTEDYSVQWKMPDESAVLELLVERFEFSEDRVKKAVEGIVEHLDVVGTQSRLDRWV